MVEWGGLWSVSFFDSFTVPFRETGILIGIACGLLNIDKSLVGTGQPDSKKD